jgi:hypothetical protein
VKSIPRESGRYLCAVLAEAINREPSFTKLIWGEDFGKSIRAVTEFPYLSTGQRKADLAIIRQLDGEPVALAEIKYEDEQGSNAPGELTSYLTYVETHKIHFAYITKNLPPQKQLELFGDQGNLKVAHRLYSDMGERLATWLSNHPSSTLGPMLADYFRDEGFMWNRQIDLKALKILIIKGARLPHSHGNGKMVTEDRMTEGVPGVMTSLLHNAGLLGRALRDEIDPTKKLISTYPSIDFSFEPTYSAKALAKIIKSKNLRLQKQLDTDDCVGINRWENAVMSGDFWAGAQMTVKNAGMRVLSITTFSLPVGNGGKLNISASAEVYGRKLGSENEWSHFENIKFKINDEETIDLVERDVRLASLRCISRCISDCLKGSNLEKSDKDKLMLIAKACNLKAKKIK